jgi:hypothetical protein
VRITYTPDDGEKREWDFKPGRLLATEVEAIEKVTDMTFMEWAEAMSKGSATGLRGLVWVLRKRHGEPELRYRDVDFSYDSVAFEPDEEEIAAAEAARAVPKGESLSDDSD